MYRLYKAALDIPRKKTTFLGLVERIVSKYLYRLTLKVSTSLKKENKVFH